MAFPPCGNFDVSFDPLDDIFDAGVNFLEPDSSEVPGELPPFNFTARTPSATLAFDSQSIENPADNSTSYVTSYNHIGIHQYPAPQEVLLNEDSSPDSEPTLLKYLKNSQKIIEPLSSVLPGAYFQPDQKDNLTMSFNANGTFIRPSIGEHQTSAVPPFESTCSSGQTFWAPTPRPEHTSEGPGNHPYLDEAKFASAAECLTLKRDLDNATAFGSFEEALEWRKNNGQNSQDLDKTIPTKAEQKQALVKVLFKAFKSIAKASDNESMIRPFRQMKHDNIRVEVVCWEILHACIQRSTSGSLVALYDPHKLKCNPSSLTFAERFDYIVRALSTQKTICKHLFDAPFVNTFVDDPIRAKTRVESNRILNERKGRTMRAGREVTQTVSESPKKRRRSMTEETEYPEDRGSPYLTPAPTHRRQPHCRSSSNTNSGGSSYPFAKIPITSGSPAYTGFHGLPRSVGSSPNQISSPYLSSSPAMFTHSPMYAQGYSQLRSTSDKYLPSSQGNREMGLMYDPTTMPTLNKTYKVAPSYSATPTSNPRPPAQCLYHNGKADTTVDAQDEDSASTDDAGDSDYVEPRKKRARAD